MTDQSITYKDAGVDIDAANLAKKRIRVLARETFTPGVLSDIGAFGGMFACDFGGIKTPVLVSSTDGVGTKLKVAVMMNRHNTVGADLVNHCVNDILVQGARPLFFMDYIATGRLDPDVVVSVVEGVARGCKQAGCALIGGETAEMPGFYPDGEYDIAGFIVGIVDRPKIIDGRGIVPGDVLIGLPSSGLHTNGYSLARRVFFDIAGWKANTYVGELGKSAGDALLAPHRSYLPVIRQVLERRWAKGIAHITGGGITENLPRILPDGCAAEIDPRAWQWPPIFRVLQQRGSIAVAEMFRAFNMGIGLIVACAAKDVDRVLNTVAAAGEQNARRIGVVVAGDRTVRYL